MLNSICPVCGDSDNSLAVLRNNLITMQNYIYQSYNDALNAQTGQFELRACRNCGFAYNSTFNSNLLSYDENYDNNVPSSIFLDYYKQIASFLYDKFSLENGFVIDVGCGKGIFLKVLCDMYPNVQGLGIDPSYELNNSSKSIPNLKFIQDIFKEEHITQKPSLILCRHVLEHIECPIPFLQSIRSAISSYPEIPFFIEVPDLEWIVDNNTFWDFCYEHCNYFTTDSLKNALQLTGFNLESVQKAFNGQYLWSLGKIEQSCIETLHSDSISDRLISYSHTEKDLMSKTKSRLEELKEDGNLIAVWGMSTKGVLLCNLLDPEKQLFDYCIDINPKKAECFVPHTGHQINSPEKLSEVGFAKLTVVVMNPNYVNEINKTCQNMNLSPVFIDASANDLTVN